MMEYKVLKGVAIAVGTIGWVIIGWIASASQIAHECRMMNQFYVGTTVYDCDVARQPLTVPKTKPPGTP